jgi:hypothetical protein
MTSDKKQNRLHGIQKAATDALEAARNLAPGEERIAALKQAGLLRKEADKVGLIFAKRGRPAK